jgi:O-antigen/teichoic acid export membrane protein
LQAIAFIPSVLISRRFGPEGKGLMSLWLYVPAVLVALSSLGLASAGQYFVSRSRDQAPYQLTNILLPPLALSLLAALAFYLTYGVWRPHLENIRFAEMLPALLILPTSLVLSHCTQFLIALDQVGRRNLALLVQTLFTAVLIAVMMLFPELSLVAVLWAYIAGFALGAVLSLYYCVKAAGSPRLPPLGVMIQSIKYGFWIYLSALLRLLTARIGFFLVLALGTLSEGGIFSVCLAVISPLVSLPWAVQSVLFPKTSGQTDEESRRSTPRYLRQLTLVVVLITALVAAFSYPILSIFGPEFVEGQAALCILLIGIIFVGQNSVLSTHIMGRGKPWLATIGTAMGLAACVILSYILIPGFGIVGAAVAVAAARAGFMLVSLLFYLSITGAKLRELYKYSREDLRVFRDVARVVVDSGRTLLRRS